MDKKKKIIKAEILFSRKCNLKCSYCKMVTNVKNTLSIEDWKNGLINLKELGCELVVFYGAEPLLEFDKLKHVIKIAANLSIDTTVITNGTVKNTKEKLCELYNNGLRSLSMSYDPLSLDRSSALKSEQALEILLWFKKFKDIRDVAAIATITAGNYSYLPDMVKRMSAHGIWTFYDLYHFDRKQIGSKVAPLDDYYAFDVINAEGTRKILNQVNDMKKDGYLVHTNQHYIDILNKNSRILLDYNWNCADYDQFPSWVTIDCDGTVYPCDDFQPKLVEPFKVTKLSTHWEEFSTKMKLMCKAICPGCFWNTHVGAHAIKAGIENIDDYVHGRK